MVGLSFNWSFSLLINLSVTIFSDMVDQSFSLSGSWLFSQGTSFLDRMRQFIVMYST